MNANLLRRVNWLWKHRHNHDGENFQEQITVLKTTIEELSDGGGESSSGARIHLVLGAAQTIAVGGELVEWTEEDHRFSRLEFAQPNFPATAVEILKGGNYYGVLLRDFVWGAWTNAGTLQVIRTRDGVDVVVEEWVADDGQEFDDGYAAPIPCEAGDLISVFLDHEDSSTQDLQAGARMAVFLIHGEALGGWELVFEVADNWGVTHDGANWWTTAAPAASDPALFERSHDGTVLNSYSGWDDGNGVPAGELNASIVYVAKLWGVGESDDPAASQIDPADGSVDSSFSPNTGGLHGWLGIGYDGTNLWLVDAATANKYVEEYTTAGVFQQQIAMPSGHTLGSITWDGVHWWGNSLGGSILKLDTSFVILGEIAGPPAGSNYAVASGGGPYGDVHYRDGFLYVMTRQGLWRKAV